MNDTTELTPAILSPTTVKALLSMLPCLFFLYINCVMLFALFSKPLLLESSRYILFGHLLLTESLQLLIIMLLYILAVGRIRVISYVCAIVVQVAAVTVKISPLNLTVMSLERYVAVCFPLRHCDIATTKRTAVAIAVMWTLASLDSFTHIFVFFSIENKSFTLTSFCIKHNVFQQQIYSSISKAFIIVIFVSVSLIIIYTYIAIMITVKTASSNVCEASKAPKTVLLHLFQLFLCLTSTLFDRIYTTNVGNINPTMAINIQYALFVSLIIFPKCLSPLIYGLRDSTFRQVFKYYFTFGFKIDVKISPKS